MWVLGSFRLDRWLVIIVFSFCIVVVFCLCNFFFVWVIVVFNLEVFFCYLFNCLLLWVNVDKLLDILWNNCYNLFWLCRWFLSKMELKWFMWCVRFVSFLGFDFSWLSFLEVLELRLLSFMSVMFKCVLKVVSCLFVFFKCFSCEWSKCSWFIVLFFEWRFFVNLV